MGQAEIVYLPIKKEDCEVFRTVALLSRMKERMENIREVLRKQAEKAGSSDIRAKFAFSLFNIMANNATDVLESKTNVEDALETLEDILELEPSYWLAKIYKLRILLMLPSSFRDEEEIIVEINDMLRLQSKSEYQPYFIVTYILLIGLYWSMGNKKMAESAIMEAQKLKKERIRYLSDFLSIMFDELERKLKLSGELENSAVIAELKRDFFY